MREPIPNTKNYRRLHAIDEAMKSGPKSASDLMTVMPEVKRATIVGTLQRGLKLGMWRKISWKLYERCPE